MVWDNKSMVYIRNANFRIFSHMRILKGCTDVLQLPFRLPRCFPVRIQQEPVSPFELGGFGITLDLRRDLQVP
jgi:hypothetical protein